MSLGRILSVLVFCALCVSCSTPPPPAEVAPTAETSTESAAPVTSTAAAPTPVDTDTVESLAKDVDGLQRDLIQYAGPLTPKQESEVESIKKKIDNKESKKAKMELQKMLGDWKEEE